MLGVSHSKLKHSELVRTARVNSELTNPQGTLGSEHCSHTTIAADFESWAFFVLYRISIAPNQFGYGRGRCQGWLWQRPMPGPMLESFQHGTMLSEAIMHCNGHQWAILLPRTFSPSANKTHSTDQTASVHRKPVQICCSVSLRFHPPGKGLDESRCFPLIYVVSQVVLKNCRVEGVFR